MKFVSDTVNIDGFKRIKDVFDVLQNPEKKSALVAEILAALEDSEASAEKAIVVCSEADAKLAELAAKASEVQAGIDGLAIERDRLQAKDFELTSRVEVIVSKEVELEWISKDLAKGRKDLEAAKASSEKEVAAMKEALALSIAKSEALIKEYEEKLEGLKKLIG